MSGTLKNIIRFILFIAIQVFILNKIPFLHRFITPYIYYLFLLWLPLSISRVGLLVTGFITGLTLDYFMVVPGLHAAACVLIAYARPFIIQVLIPKDSSEFTYREPSPGSMGWRPYGIYVFVLTFLHHGYLTFLQWLDFGTFFDFIIKVVATTGISMLLILTAEFLVQRNRKFRASTT